MSLDKTLKIGFIAVDEVLDFSEILYLKTQNESISSCDSVTVTPICFKLLLMIFVLK